MKGIFTTKPIPSYDDLPEMRYHFPKTYLNQVQRTVGDWIAYYEPRRSSAELSSRGGRQGYFATARVIRVEQDTRAAGLYYAYVDEYLEFDNIAPFSIGGKYFETALKKADGTTSKGAFGRAVRLIRDEEYQFILDYGFALGVEEKSAEHIQGDELLVQEEQQMLRTSLVTSRLFRKRAFARKIASAYDFTCAMTGLKLINGGGRPEIEAAHIRPVGAEHHGPDSTRNGIALSRTFHWLFDRGIISIADDYKIILVEKSVPDQLKNLLLPEGKIRVPDDPLSKPHQQFLRYHREQIYRGVG
ncbi:MAG: HNH endonuclease [Syntrophobacteraceae bacterium]|jgi:putative restriction endonuclease